MQFKSRPRKASPLFLGLCLAASGKLASYSFSPSKPPRSSKEIGEGSNGGLASKAMRALSMSE